jgi:ankyrin repeat protein
MGDYTKLLHHLLSTGAAKDDRNQNKHTPLSWAAEYGALDSIKILLEHRAKSTPWIIHIPPHYYG